MLLVLEGLTARNVRKEGMVKFAFWSINIGLALMALLSLLPIGLYQTWASAEFGFWYARSAEAYAGTYYGSTSLAKDNW